MQTGSEKLLAWFLGPKAENAALAEQFVRTILQDYAYWRRNYFPDDPILEARSLQRQLEPELDALEQRLQELMAQLRRNFPFYSPRYMAHQLSDVSLGSLLGCFAGMLFNPNNVTPEAAPVTALLEIEVCAGILGMLGFTPPPDPAPASEVSSPAGRSRYERRMAAAEFGWAHLTSGGTVANIEALWVAREVRYFPLAVREAAVRHKLEIEVQLPDGRPEDLRAVGPRQLLLLKPAQAIFLLPAFVAAIARARGGLSPHQAAREAWRLAGQSRLALSRGTGVAFLRHPPRLLAAGTNHYSIRKAANVLGIGAENVDYVATDAAFRMDTADLRSRLLKIVRSKRDVPLAVIATAGTTEEGAVDPVHEIEDLRREFEREHNASFWLHVDAAWGGYVRSLFTMGEADRCAATIRKASRLFGIEDDADLTRWHAALAQRARDAAGSATPPPAARAQRKQSEFRAGLASELDRMASFAAAGDHERYRRALERLPDRLSGRLPQKLASGALRFALSDIHRWVRDFVSEEVPIGGEPARRIRLTWPSPGVGNAFLAIAKADSVTIDPHKMGYAPYPAGCVAFRNDRVRLFVMQQAPYITEQTQNPLFHVPPRHLDPEEGRVHTDSLGPFILEGSRPGGVAAGLWLSQKITPLTAGAHGLIVKQSLLAAREFYEWLLRWQPRPASGERGFVFLPLTAGPPDTNIVAFAIRPRGAADLAAMNALTRRVYADFAIRSEMGEQQYSYSQAFFVSHTTLAAPNYPAAALSGFFGRAGLDASATDDYERESLAVLRCTLMNPYLVLSRDLGGQNVIRQLVEALAASASKHLAATASREAGEYSEEDTHRPVTHARF